MRKSRIVLVILAMLAVPLQPSSAQILSSTQDVRDRNSTANATAGAVELRRIAPCVFEVEHAHSLLLLSSKPGSSEEQNIGHVMQSRMSRCIGFTVPWLTWDWMSLRGALAEAASIDMLKNYDWQQDNLAEIPIPDTWISGKNTPLQIQVLAGHELAACVAARDPKDVLALAMTVPRSKEESVVIARLTPQLNPCLAKGATMALDRSAFRSIMSQELYRSAKVWLASSPVVQSSGPDLAGKL